MEADTDPGSRSWCIIAGALALIGLCALLLACPGAQATNDPPAGGGTVTGDWTVTDSRSYSACTIALEGNLTVSGTGVLSLDAVSLVMAPSYDGQYGIEVQSGGALGMMDGSNLSSVTAGVGYGFVVQSGGNLTVTDSELRGCGYSWGTDGSSAGLFLRSDKCSLSRTVLTSCYYGVVVRGCSPAFADCQFSGDSYGAGLVDSSASFSGCAFAYDASGANADNWSGKCTNCTFSYNTGFGLLAYDSAGSVSGCLFEANAGGNCVLMNSEISLSDSSLLDSAYGLYVSKGRPDVSGCTLMGNRCGVYLYKSSASMKDCNITQSSLCGVTVYYGAPVLVRCEISYTGYDPYYDRFYGIGMQAFSSNVSISGGGVEHNADGIDFRYCSPVLSNVSFSDNDFGISAYQSETRVTGCNFSGDRQAGAMLSFFCSGQFEGCSFSCETVGCAYDYFSSTGMANSTFIHCRLGLEVYDCDDSTVIRGCTFDMDTNGADIANSRARLVSCRFLSCNFSALTGRGASPAILDCTFSSGLWDAVVLTGCGGVVDGSKFEANLGAGLSMENCTTEVSNDTFTGNEGSGVRCLGKGSAPDIHDDLFTGNPVGATVTAGASGRIHNNTFTNNSLVGVSLSGSRAEIYCNTISGGMHGISCDGRSSPFIHDNEVYGNEGGILLRMFSDATVARNSVHNNSMFGISVLGSWPDLEDNEVSGSLDGIRLDNCTAPGTVVLSENHIFNNTDGINANGSDLSLTNCNLTGNLDAGALLEGCSALVWQCTFYQNGDGLVAGGGDVQVEDCDFMLNAGAGVVTDATDAFVDGCFFYRNTDGVLDIGNSTLAVYDGVYEQDLVGIWCGAGTDASWTIQMASSAVDDQFHLTGNLTVVNGGSLRLTNATLFLALDRPGEHGIEVQNGGRLEMLQGSQVAAADPANRYTFRVQRGGKLTIEDGKVIDCGDSWGVAGERAGLLLLGSGCTLSNVYFYNCTYGLVANGITGDFNYLTFVACGYGVVALSSRLTLENSSIYLSAVADIELQQGALVTLVNTTFDRNSVIIMDPKCILEVYWYLGVNVAWQNKVMVSNAELTLDDAAGNHQVGGYTDGRGWLQWVTVLEYRQNFTSSDERNPYTMMVRLANITSRQDMIFKKSVILYLTLNDFTPPALEIDLPAEGALLNFTPVEIRGIAHDFETGLVSVEWSSDGRSWQPANGTGQWSLMAYLSDGNHSILVRATDAVGNRALQGVDFTVKTTITVLEVAGPADGLLTSNAAVLVNGTTEMGARVLINGRSVQVQLGKFSTTVFLDEGNNTILITATDDAGNTATVWRTVVLDTTAPFIELQSPRDGSYVDIMQTIVSGRTEPGAKVLVNGQVLINSDGRFSQAVDLPDETNIINITVIDPAGNLNSTEVLVHVDTALPSLDIIYPRIGHHTSAGKIAIRGTTKPFSTVTMGEAVAAAGEDGAFSLNITLFFGNNTILIRSTDRAGNVNSTTWFVVRDRPSSGQNTPWLPAIVLFVAVLAAENAAILGIIRRKRTAPPAASPVRSAPPDALPVPDEMAADGEIPMATVRPVEEKPLAGPPASGRLTAHSYRPPGPPSNGRPPGPPATTQRPEGLRGTSRPPGPPQRPPGPDGGGAKAPGARPVEEESVETVEMR